MSKKGSILLVEDDLDDQEMIAEVLKGLEIDNHIVYFENGKQALDYLTSTTDTPFLILCDMNLPIMGGIELRQCITNNEVLRSKSIPFIFLTTTASPLAVKEAYEMSVQGFFEKSASFTHLRNLVKLIYNYWQECKHPNS